MSFLRKNPFATLGILAIALVGLPAAIFLSQNQADDRSRAARTVILSFAPTSSQSAPISVPTSTSVTLDLMLDPGTNAVSFLKTELTYDPTKFQVDNGGFQVNKDVFPQTIQGPVYSSGKISFAVSVGADGTKAIQTPAKAGTLTLKALPASGISQVGFSAGTQALSISSSSTPTENVVSNTIPAYLTVSNTIGTTTPTPPPNACTSINPSNTMLVIDKSGSMSVATDVNKITQAKTAAKNYVDILSQDTRNTVGLVSYENTATVNNPLTTDYPAVKAQIDSLTAIGSTCTECAILKANQEIAKSTSASKKIVVLLTDGKANYIEGGSSQVDVALAEQKALAAAIAGNSAKGTIFYTIGLGQEINGAFLQQIATSTGGKYFPSPTADQLNAIYQQISVIAAQGSVSGFVFNDADSDSTYDTTEQKLSGWVLQLTNSSTGAVQSFTSDANGFNITGLCNGNYTLKEVVQTGWRQTLPPGNLGYPINIVNGNAITDRNFGNNQGNTCADGIDNNNNNKIDIADPVCHTDGDANNPNTYDPNRPETGNTCADGIDNNNNNKIDIADPVCHTDGNPNNPGSYDPNRPETGNTCADGIDNNGNNLIDIKDPICHKDGNPNNPGSYDPNLPERKGNTCADGIDNNNNGVIDGLDQICLDKTCSPAPSPVCDLKYNPDLPESGGNGTSLNLTIFLHGIGNSGDNVNQNLSSLSNKNPLTKSKQVQAFIYNASNELVSSTSGQVNYSSASGNYTGRVQTAAPLVAGSYNIRLGTDRHLVRRIPGIQNIVTSGENSLPAVHLVTGDIDDNNKLNILDYNILIDCYTDTLPAPSCSDQAKKASSDTNDDGLTNQTDYNLFLREIANQPGE